MTLNPGAGGAQPVVIVTDAETQGGVAIPVYGYSATPTDRPVLGGKAWRVKVIGDSDLRQNGGKYQLMGAPVALPVVTDVSGNTEGGIAIAVYPVNSWPPAPAGNASLLLESGSYILLESGDKILLE